MPATTIARYASVVSTLGRPMPTWVTNPDDAVRVAAYDAYDDMYDNVPLTFMVAMRGTNDNPIYVPSTKKIVEAVNRYLGKGWNWTVSTVDANAANEEAARAWLSGVYTNNKMPSKFGSAKRGMLRRGDSILHIIGRPDRPAGSRVQIVEIHPRTYFPIEDATDPEGVTGVYIVNLLSVQDTEGSKLTRSVALRQEYRYRTVKGQRRVFSRLAFFETDAWDDRYPGHGEIKEVDTPQAFDTPAMQGVLKGIMLPDAVTKIPVYHIVNNRTDEERFGTAEVAGMETLIAAKNQAVSDEDITLALVGLGLYTTTAGRPVNDEGVETDWVIAPGWVVELKEGESFDKVPGVDDMKPYQDHIHTVSDDVSVANTFDDPLPVDRAATVTEVTALVTAGLMSKEFAISVLKDKLGYDFPTDMMDQITAAADAEAARVAAEMALSGVNDPNAGNGSPGAGQPAIDQIGVPA
jgi:hypothetical protein